MFPTAGGPHIIPAHEGSAAYLRPPQVLPSGLELPPVPFVLALLVAAAVVAVAVYRLQPRITDRTVLAFVPWMAAGAAAHALSQVDAAPAVVDPLFGAPTVYATTLVTAGGVWAALEALDGPSVDPVLAAIGGVATLALGVAVLATGIAAGTWTAFVPVTSLVAATVATALVFALIREVQPRVVTRTGCLGAVVLFGHLLDGVTTALGVDVLGTGERSPIPEAIMDVAGTLPTADVIGVGWLFVCVKLGVAVLVLWLFADMVEDDPVTAYGALGAVAAVGLGPGVHNLLLFAAIGGA